MVHLNSTYYDVNYIQHALTKFLILKWWAQGGVPAVGTPVVTGMKMFSSEDCRGWVPTRPAYPNPTT